MQPHDLLLHVIDDALQRGAVRGVRLVLPGGKLSSQQTHLPHVSEPRPIPLPKGSLSKLRPPDPKLKTRPKHVLNTSQTRPKHVLNTS
eukprot:1190072-Prorocentrum_minimum.AAC.2